MHSAVTFWPGPLDVEYLFKSAIHIKYVILKGVLLFFSVLTRILLLWNIFRDQLFGVTRSLWLEIVILSLHGWNTHIVETVPIT